MLSTRVVGRGGEDEGECSAKIWSILQFVIVFEVEKQIRIIIICITLGIVVVTRVGV